MEPSARVAPEPNAARAGVTRAVLVAATLLSGGVGVNCLLPWYTDQSIDQNVMGVLFIEGIDPRAALSSLSDDELRALLRRAHGLLRRNLGSGPRTTRPTLGHARLWVYGRKGRPCFRCRTPVVRWMSGPAPGRSTYSCPTCQPDRTAPRGEVRS